MFDRGENGISLLGITGYAIIEVDGKYVMVEMLLGAVPFGDVKHTGDAILRASKQQLAGYGVGQYECSFTAAGTEIVLLDTVLQSVHMKVTDNASNIKKAFKFFDGGFCFLHTLELVVREFMGNESVQPWMIKIKGLCRHLKMSLSGWTCFAELCAMRHVKIVKPPIGGDTRWGGHHQQVLWHTMREVAVSEYYSEGPKAAIWLMDFEHPQLTGVAKCELNTWEWQNSKVASATLNIPYESTLLMQGTQYPTCNLVMPQLHQMISGLEMPKITYVHTAQRETISIHEALDKAVMPEKMKLILKARTQMVESIYKYFDLDLSESHRAKLYICTLLDPRFKKFNFWPTRKYVDNSQLCTECI